MPENGLSFFLTDFWLQSLTIGYILLLALLLYGVLRLIALRLITMVTARTKTDWDQTFVRRGFFHQLIKMAPGVLVHALAGIWFAEESQLQSGLQLCANLWVIVFGLLALYAFLDALTDIYNTLSFAKKVPIRSFTQVLKLVAFLLMLLMTIAMLLGQSPMLLISGLGALTAVLMLIFKDPILGFVAGITLSVNQMLTVGDWLEMPKYNADGDVIDITLTTVKVRNWDQTITTIPTYALISDSFKNWRGMTEAGGRRIKRSVFIDMTSVRFLNNEDIGRLRKAQLLTQYLEHKLADIQEHNRLHAINPDSPINGRHLTNIGTFRAYLVAYLKAHAGIHQKMIMIVRQLQPTETGLPLEIYAFTSDTGWVAHEAVQSDIFDHILAVLPEFGLRVYQTPSGNDIRSLTLSQLS